MHHDAITRSRLVSILVGLALLTAACGDDDDVAGDAPQTTEAEAPEPDAPASSAFDCEGMSFETGIPATSIEYLPLFVGQDQGIFDDAGISLNVRELRPDIAAAAVLSGELDFTFASTGLMRAALEGSPGRRIMDSQNRSLFSLMAKPEIESVAGLAGKTISMSNISGAPLFAIRQVLEEEGLGEDDYTMTQSGNYPASLAALLNGAADAASLSVPFNLDAEDAGFRELIAPSDFPEVSPAGLGTSMSKIENEPEEIKCMINTMLDAIAFTQDPANEATVVDVIGQRYEYDEERSQRLYDDVVPVFASAGRSPVDAVAFELVSEQNPSPDADLVASVTDYSLLEEVLEERGQ